MQGSADRFESLAPQIPRNWVKGEKIQEKVYLVRDPSYPPDKKFVVKEIFTKDAKKDRSSNVSELEILKNVNHFRIVRFYGSILIQEKPEKLLIFMEYMEKGTLANYIQQTNEHGLDIEEVRIFSRQILEGVSYLHNYQPQIIHRDIKGKNILLKDKRNIKLSDFGVSKMISSIACDHTGGVGTFKWMAPEVFSSSNNGHYDFKADIWSVGCTVVEMATGGPIFPNLSNSEAIRKIGDGTPPQYDLPQDAPAELNTFLNSMFKKNPNERPTADELLKHQFMKEIRLSDKMPHDRLIKGEEIGSGTFGKVYLATDPDSEAKFALKEMEIRASEREMIMESFRQEYKIMSTVEHSRVVKFYGFIEAGNVLSIYMEYVPMGSLEDYIEGGKTISQDDVGLYTRQILEGVKYLHEKNIIHRDINGKHVLMESESSVKIGGSGVSKALRHDPNAKCVLQEGTDIGCVSTLHWMAPELIRFVMDGVGAYDNKVDIWSVGCTVVQMVTGHPPFKDLTKHQHLYEILKMEPGKYPPYKIPQERQSVSLENFIRTTLEIDPQSRPSAEGLLKNSLSFK